MIAPPLHSLPPCTPIFLPLLLLQICTRTHHPPTPTSPPRPLRSLVPLVEVGRWRESRFEIPKSTHWQNSHTPAHSHPARSQGPCGATGTDVGGFHRRKSGWQATSINRGTRDAKARAGGPSDYTGPSLLASPLICPSGPNSSCSLAICLVRPGLRVVPPKEPGESAPRPRSCAFQTLPLYSYPSPQECSKCSCPVLADRCGSLQGKRESRAGLLASQQVLTRSQSLEWASQGSGLQIYCRQ